MLRGADHPDRGPGAPQPGRDHTLREFAGGHPLRFRDPVGLVQYEQQVRHSGIDLLDQRQLLGGDRRIGAKHHEGDVDVRDEIASDSRVCREHGPKTRRVHKAHAACEQLTRREHLDPKHAADVARIVLLGHV